ncbi:tripartite tricarboxylate transporter TctB family protein [Clostridium sp. AM58-1XD]|uniref:tripartite tricarboxylate transporter TctB family protein n=1 Tax=Clostridium sp. AM58-1XD TaxID=2292307 RepID=UPI000E52BF6F|nr:tripartite tricarboxylate transporter TctB family protein [Clostridium sp. AM58-1XD]RGZ01177.1 tripartite tricarboxylate transporter TctB family protein [Clostridium sp. AM58-1XD]
MSQKKRDIASGIVFFLLAVALYAGSYSIVVTTTDAMGPQFFPRTVAVMMGVLAAAQIVLNVRKPEMEGEKGEADTGGFNIRSITTIAILFLYAVLVQKVGFVVMTMLYLFGQIMLLLPEKRLKSGKSIVLTLIISVAVPVLIYQLFYHAFSIFLPTGILG